MAFKAGTVSYFSLDTAGGAGTNLSPYIDTLSVPQTTEMLDVSVFGTAAKGFIPGLTNGDVITLSGPLDVAMHSHLVALKAAQEAGTASHSFVWGPGGSVASQAKISGECLLAAYEPSSGVAGRVEFSASLQITGAVTNGTW